MFRRNPGECSGAPRKTRPRAEQHGGVEVDLHQLELRHLDLRIHDGEQRRRLIGSVAEIGQQVPVVVIRDAERLVLIDGYLRVEVLRRLHCDTALATTWPVSEIEALVHHRHLSGGKRTALEDAWLLRRLRDHGVTLDQLAHRLCRSKSWVSRRLGLLEVLGASAQERVRSGTVSAQAAMKYLAPLARANKRQSEQLIAGLGETQVSVREFGMLYTAWRRADQTGKQHLVAEPLLVLRALAALAEEPEDEVATLHKDLSVLTAVALRAGRRVRAGGRFTAPLTKAWRAASEAFATLGATIEKMHAGPDLKDPLVPTIPNEDLKAVRLALSSTKAPKTRGWIRDQTQRQTILTLREAGNGIRAIARALGISRGAVKRVLGDGQASPPPLERPEKAEAHRDDILALLADCKGNLVRVHESLRHAGS